MPTLLQIGRYRFFIYSGDRDEPVHVHIECEGKRAEFWLDPVRLQYSAGLNRSEINHIKQLVEANKEILQRGWDEFFNG